MRLTIVARLFAVAWVLVAVSACAVRESGATCDDDVDNDGDGKFDCADTDCILAPACQPCGDGSLDDSEACDDGNDEDDDGCSARCLIEGCGDGVRDEGEACDDGNLEPADGCDFRCQLSRCGDGQVDFGALNEECDDANVLSGDGCSSRCQVERNGVLCGNGQFDLGEECEDGNRRDGDGCSSLCRGEFCGDGVTQPLRGEQCDGDDVPPGPNGEAQRCENCQIVRCGNGSVQIEVGEECDDGNRIDGDGCSQFCRIERCGDFQIITPENCDDGNRISGDGCNSECRQEFCGDGVVQPRLGELCDDDSADCQGCIASRACVDGGVGGEICFALERGSPQLFPTSAALLAAPAGGTERAVLGSATSSGVFVFDLVGGSFGASQTVFEPNFTAIIAVRAVDLDGNGQDELVVMSNDFTAGVFNVSSGDYQRRVSFFDRVLDVGAADVAGNDELDIVASSRTGQIAVSFADGSVSLVQLDVLCGRVLGAPVRSGGGVIAACGDVVTAIVGKSPGTVSSPLVVDGTRAIGADIRDIAVGDLDGDGVDEVVVLTIAPDEVHMLTLDGNGLAADASLVLLSAAPGADAIAVRDMDGDGNGDLIVTSERGAMAIHFAAADFAASSLPVMMSATRAAAGDIDDDGDVDLFVGGGFFQTEALLYVQE